MNRPLHSPSLNCEVNVIALLLKRLVSSTSDLIKYNCLRSKPMSGHIDLEQVFQLKSLNFWSAVSTIGACSE